LFYSSLQFFIQFLGCIFLISVIYRLSLSLSGFCFFVFKFYFEVVIYLSLDIPALGILFFLLNYGSRLLFFFIGIIPPYFIMDKN
ncbi:MAG: hypothetical protein ACI4I4_06310, partial [Acutalibacteraceae bacterium]